MPLRRTIGKWLLPSTAVALLLLAAGHAIRSQLPEPILPPPVTPSTNPFGNVVAGAGFVEPSTEASTVSIISVGSQLSGVITKVAVHIDQEVNEGDLLFQLDKRATNAQLKIRQAMLAAAEAQLAKLEKQPRPEEVPPLEAQLRASTASLATAIDIRNRDRKLVATKSITDEELFASEQTAATAQAQLELAQANLALLKAGAWQPDKDIARTAVDEAQAQLDETRTTLELLEVRAPVTGTILQVNVRSGEFVSASPTQSLVVMGNLKPYHVRVSIDEEDIPRLKLDAPG
ncbi:MAG TPA: biotin/lipoyl-binding protein, partial [Pirellulales bacterium]|nr:biotin/lipoyl-binding protein [Pirellulales bacterium]